MNIPDPVEKMKFNVRSQPGQSYPTPPSRVNIREQNIHPGFPSGRPPYEHASRSVTPNQFGGAGGSPGAGMDPNDPNCQQPTMIR
jgi:hypothetical protein